MSNKMSKKFIITFCAVLFAILALTSILIVNFNKQNNNSPITYKNDNEVTTDRNSIVDRNVSRNVSYTLKTDKDLTLKELDKKVSVKDPSGNEVDVKFKKVNYNTYTMEAPDEGYIDGCAYSVDLDEDVEFADNEKNDKHNRDFIIKKDNIQNIELNDNVIKVKDKSIEIYDNYLISSIAYATGTILVVKKDDKFHAYKVDNCEGNGGKFRITTSLPDENEVYKVIDFKGNFKLSDGDLIFNKENLDRQLNTANLSLSLDFNIKDILPKITYPRMETDKENNKVYLDILFSYDIPFLDTHISLLVSNVIDIDPFTNYNKFPISFELGANMKLTTTTKFDFKSSLDFDKTYNMEDVAQKLASLANVTLPEKLLKIFKWTMPIGQTGIMVSYDIDLAIKIEYSGSIEAEAVTTSTYTLGSYYANGKVKKMSENNDKSFKLTKVEIYGNINIKVGIKNTLSLSFMQVAKVSIYLDTGLYFDVYGAVIFNVDDIKKTQKQFYLDTGLYYDIALSASIKFFNLGPEKKLPIINGRYRLKELGDKVMNINFADKDEEGYIDEVYMTANLLKIPKLTMKQYNLVKKNFSYNKLPYDEYLYNADAYNFDLDENGIVKLKEKALENFKEKVTITNKKDDKVSKNLTIIRDEKLPCITNDSIQTFDKENISKISFKLNLKDSKINEITANNLKEDDYTLENDTLTIDTGYLVRQLSDYLPISIVTDKGILNVWVNIIGQIHLFSQGEGTVENPYVIYTIDQFIELQEKGTENNFYKGINFIMEEDIDFQNKVIKPMENFEGVLNGNDHKIINYKLDSMVKENIGLFAINKGEIKNLKVEGEIFTRDVRYVYAGLLVGTNLGVISNCDSNGKIDVECITKNLYKTHFILGGLVGYNKNTVKSCVSGTKIIVNSNSNNIFTRGYVAGVVGYNESNVDHCFGNKANITNNSYKRNKIYIEDVTVND